MKRATTTFHYGDPDVGFRTVPAGKLVADDDPILDVHGGLFVDADDVPEDASTRKTSARRTAKSKATDEGSDR